MHLTPSCANRPHAPRFGRRRVAGLALLLVLVASGCEGWGPITSSYNGKTRVTASGDARLDHHTTMVNRIVLKDPIKDKNRVYAHTNWWYHHEVCTFGNGGKSCTVKWDRVAVSATPELSDGGQGTFEHKRGLMASADASRIAVVACAQMGWPVPDSCSNEQAIITFDS